MIIPSSEMNWVVWAGVGSIKFSRLVEYLMCSDSSLLDNSSFDVGFNKNKTDVLIKPIVSSIEKFVMKVLFETFFCLKM